MVDFNLIEGSGRVEARRADKIAVYAGQVSFLREQPRNYGNITNYTRIPSESTFRERNIRHYLQHLSKVPLVVLQ